MNRVKLIDFLHRLSEDTRHNFDRLTLRHLDGSRNVQGAAIWDYKRDERDVAGELVLDPIDTEAVATDIEISANDDALGIGGMQRYSLLAYPRGSKTPARRFTFRVYGAPDDDDEENNEDAAPTEDATPKGLVQAAMRHQEVNFKSSALAMHQVMQAQSRIIERQERYIEEADKRRLEIFELQERLISNVQERDLRAEEAAQRQEMFREGFEMTKALLPHVANKLTGKRILPERSDPLQESLMKLFGSMNGDEQAAFAEFMLRLSPSNKLAVSTLIDSLDAKVAADEARDKAEEEKRNGAPKAH